jgi:KDO2-lipid IV(A) lauroyltransferase
MLGIGFPEKGEAERKAMGAEVFANLGLGGAEFLRFKRLGPGDVSKLCSKVTGWEACEATLSTGRGIVFVTAHMGHWELLASWTALHSRVGVVARQVYDGRLDKALNEARASKGLTVFARNTSVRPILRWLKGGGVVGTLADQDTGVDSLFVNFFGRECKTPSGPAWLAAASGAELRTAFCRRLDDGTYELEYQGPIEVAPGLTDKKDLKPIVQEYTRRTEEFIRSAPTQWAWNHDRWRSKKEEASTGWQPGEA